MPLLLQDLPIIVLLAFGFAAAMIITAIIVSAIGKVIKEKSEGAEEKPTEYRKITTKTSGEQLDRLYQYTVYILVFEIIIVLLVFPLYGLNDILTLVDLWPFILSILVIIFICLAVVDWSKLKSKRTAQKDMRRF